MSATDPQPPSPGRRNGRNGGGLLSLRLSQALSTGWLVLVWVAVTGSYTVASVLGGTVVALLITTLFRPRPHDGPVHRVHPLALLRYVGHFLHELIVANVEVAAAVIDPGRVAHARGIIEVRLVPSSRLVGAVLANAVSLTPGTSIIEVSESPPSLHVHVLHIEEVDAVRSSIAELHWRLIAALGPVHALDAAREHARQLQDRLNGSAGTNPGGAADTGEEDVP